MTTYAVAARIVRPGRSTDEPPQRVELLQRNLAKHGTVYNTLARACAIDGRIVVVTPSEAAVR